MRVCAAVLTIALLGAEPSPVPSPVVADRLVRLAGTWSCRNAYAEPGTLNVTIAAGSVMMSRTTQTQARPAETRDRFVPDPSTGGWSVRSNGRSFNAVGPPWTGPTWTLDGQLASYGVARPGHLRFELLPDESLRITRWFEGDADVVDAALCVRGRVPPPESVCVTPNVPATVVVAPSPTTPAAGVGGLVHVLVSLDADGHVTDAVVRHSDAAVLNASALDAARRATYRAARRDCRPVPSQYLFTVSYN